MSPENHSECALAIVGSRDVPDYQAESLVKQVILEHGPKMIISGGVRGVDSMARRIGVELGLPVVQYLPASPSWEAPEVGQPVETIRPWGLDVIVPGGFRSRNEKIAESCDCLVRIASQTTKTYGSGWTADRAAALGKRVFRHTV